MEFKMKIRKFKCQSCGKLFYGQGNSKFCYDCTITRAKGIRKMSMEILKDEDKINFLYK